MIGTKPVDLVWVPNGDGETEKLAGSVAESPVTWKVSCTYRQTDSQTDRQTQHYIYTRLRDEGNTAIDMSYFAITIQHSSLDWGRIKKRSGRPLIEIASNKRGQSKVHSPASRSTGFHQWNSFTYFRLFFFCCFFFFVYFFFGLLLVNNQKVCDTRE